MRLRPLLSVVIPAWNEADAIGDVLAEWDEQLAGLGVPYEVRVYDDGSTDATADVVATVARARPALTLVRQANRGHGPTILRGYHEARGDWVLQVDGDGDIGAAFVRDLWARRDADLVLGYRVGRRVSLGRRVITAVSWWTVRFLFGAGVRDVNVPYRLYRRATLDLLLPAVPPEAFAPNVILTGLALRTGLRIAELPVRHRGRRSGERRFVRPRFWRAAARAFVETAAVARETRRAAVRPAPQRVS
jgi:glycosyltransferase involved in cell wall biosynthesis